MSEQDLTEAVMAKKNTRQNLVKISTASHRSGIRVETLRAWDNRTQLVPVQRIGNIRYYTVEQVERMKALNTLIRSGVGYAIGELCVKNDEEIQGLVADLYETPGVNVDPVTHTDSTTVVVGWRLMQLRDTSIETDEVRTFAPNIDDVEAFYEYLRRRDHDGLRMVVIELPSIWNINYINELRDKIDSFDHSDCHVIAVSFLNDPASFEQYQIDVQQKGVSLLDGSDLTWDAVLSEIESVLLIRQETTRDAGGDISSVELARLLQANERIAGIAVADIAALYQKTADITGLAKREAARHSFDDQEIAKQINHHLQTVIGELRSCVEIVRTIPQIAMRTTQLDKPQQ